MKSKKAEILWGSLLLFGLFLRLRVAFGRADMFWPDEQFQTLEPAAKVVFGYGYMAWEWIEGYRSWFVPLLYVPIVKIGAWLGLSDGLASIHWARAVTAVFDIAMWSVVARALLNAGIPLWSVGIALSTQLLFPMPVRWGASTLQDHVLMLFVGFSLPWILNPNESGKERAGFKKGVAIGLPFLVKIQAGAWIAPLLALEFFRKGKSFKLLVGASLAFFGYGLLDWISWGRPYQTLIRQVEDGNKISIFYGTEPLHFYLKEFVQVVGTPAMMAMGFVLLRLIFFPKKGLAKIPSSLIHLLIGFAIFFVALSLLPHKEFRFLLPMTVIWTSTLAFLLPRAWDAKDWFEDRSKGFQQIFPLAAVGVTLGMLPILATAALNTPIYLSSTDISELEDRIAQDQRAKSASTNETPCLVLASHNWSWSRGNMILGRKMDYVETREARPALETRFQKCSYAIVVSSEFSYFRAAWPGWAPLGPPQGFWGLLKNLSK